MRPLPDVRAGSALLEYRGRLLAIQDDAASGVWIEPGSGACRPWVFEGDGGPLPKALKPDFEAVLRQGDTAWVLASGSRPNRVRIVTLDLPSGRARAVDASPLYAALAAALGQRPNLEGAVLQGGQLWLLHRGAGPARSAILELPGAALAGTPAAPLVRWCELGDVDGVPLHFTDALALADGRILYLAAAEQTDDPVADGPVAGAALGLVEGAAARWTALLEPDGSISRRKAEGLAPAPGGAWLLTDPDDPARSAELCRAELRGFG